jgi:hypothetical protein
MSPNYTNLIKENDVVKKRLAKLMALQCFRNTELENLHAGMLPESQTGDFTDVRVVFPGGEIPWNNLSRFDDHEMKRLMINVVNQCYQFLHILFDDEQIGARIIGKLLVEDPLPEWNDPV